MQAALCARIAGACRYVGTTCWPIANGAIACGRCTGWPQAVRLLLHPGQMLHRAAPRPGPCVAASSALDRCALHADVPGGCVRAVVHHPRPRAPGRHPSACAQGGLGAAGRQSGPVWGCPAKQARLRKEGDERHPQWYAPVFHEVPADRLRPPAAMGTLGLDRNVGQVTDASTPSPTPPSRKPTSSASRARPTRPRNAPGGTGNRCPTAVGASAGNCPSRTASRNASGRPQPISTAA